MLKTRVIPTLLLRNAGLVKGVQFKDHKYVGDPINAVRIFNEKEVDEIVFLDIGATPDYREPNYDLIKDISSESFMPFAYGGGIKNIKQIERLFNLGVEKVIINSAAFYTPSLLQEASSLAGNQSIVVSIDVKTKWLGGYEVYVKNGTERTGKNPVDYAKEVQDLGAGELILTSIDREGTGKGLDLNLIESVVAAVDIPVVAHGGAANLEHLRAAVCLAHASAVAAGSLFTFHGKYKAVLLTYPSHTEIEQIFG